MKEPKELALMAAKALSDKKGKEIKEDALGGIVNSIALYLNNLK